MDGPHLMRDGPTPQKMDGSEEEMMVGPHQILVQESLARVHQDQENRARVQHL
jgi:hypothetical protein